MIQFDLRIFFFRLVGWNHQPELIDFFNGWWNKIIQNGQLLPDEYSPKVVEGYTPEI